MQPIFFVQGMRRFHVIGAEGQVELLIAQIVGGVVRSLSQVSSSWKVSVSSAMKTMVNSGFSLRRTSWRPSASR